VVVKKRKPPKGGFLLLHLALPPLGAISYKVILSLFHLAAGAVIVSTHLNAVAWFATSFALTHPVTLKHGNAPRTEGPHRAAQNKQADYHASLHSSSPVAVFRIPYQIYIFCVVNSHGGNIRPTNAYQIIVRYV
jgi:hypothetical protein